MKSVIGKAGTLRELQRDDRPGAIWCVARLVQKHVHRASRKQVKDLSVRCLSTVFGWIVGEESAEAMRRQHSQSEAERERLFRGPGTARLRSFDAHLTYACVRLCYLDRFGIADPFPSSVFELFIADLSAHLLRTERMDLFHSINTEAYEDVFYQAHPVDPVQGQHPLWDWMIERHPEPKRIGRLSEAIRRARAWGLNWHIEHERAVAERLEEVPAWWRKK